MRRRNSIKYKASRGIKRKLIECMDTLELLIEEFNPNNTIFWVFFKRKMLFVWLLVNDYLWCKIAISTHISILGFLFLNILYIFLIVLVLEDGSKWIRKVNDVRQVATQEEQKRLMPIFDEVYQRLSESEKELAKKVKLYIVDTSSILAYSIANDSIVISRGAMQVFNDSQLKGAIAHEFAHIVSGDTQVKLLIYYASSFYLYFIYFIQIILHFFENMFSNNIIGSLAGFLNSLLNLLVKVCLFVWLVLFGIHSKKREYTADKFAYNLGYGEELKSALNVLYQMQVSDKMELIDRIQEGHPRLAYRIRELEKLK